MDGTMEQPVRQRRFSVLFAEDFDLPPVSFAVTDDPPELPEPEPEPVVPSYSEDQMEAARDAAYQSGFQDGHTAAHAEIAAETAASLSSIALAFGDARAAAQAVAEQAATALTRLLLDAFAAALPSLCARHGPTEAAAVLNEILPALSREPQATVRVAPGALAAAQAELSRLDPDFARRITVTAQDTLSPGDVRVTWRDGEAVRDGVSLCARITEILLPLQAAPETKETSDVK
jgi:hypothetical protein